MHCEKGIELVPGSFYCIVAARAIFQVINSVFLNIKLPYGIQYAIGASNHRKEYDRIINSEGFNMGFPYVNQYLDTTRFSKKYSKGHLFPSILYHFPKGVQL